MAGHNLPLSTRRRNTAGLNKRLQRAWHGRRFISLGIGRRASVVLGTGNSALAVWAKTPGVSPVTIRIVNGGTAPVVTLVGSAITVTTPVASTTATDVVRAINFSTLSNPLVHAQRAPGSDGTGFVAAVGATALAGGSVPG